MLHSSCKLHSLTRHRQASSTFWSVFGGVIAPRIKRSLIHWLVLTTTLKSCADVWSAKSHLLSSSHRFKMVDSMITCHGCQGDSSLDFPVATNNYTSRADSR